MEKSTQSMRFRLLCMVFTVMILVAVYISYTMYNVAVKESDKYQQLANSQQFKTMTIAANRGSIYDSTGQVLAQSVTVYTVFVDPKTFQERDRDRENDIVGTLSNYLDVDGEEIRKKLYQNNQYQIIKKDVDKVTVEDMMEALNPTYDKDYEGEEKVPVTSVGATPTAKRYYPHNDLAAAVIGHLHYDGYGILGLESYYDEYLTGVDGKIITAVDAHNREFSINTSSPTTLRTGTPYIQILTPLSSITPKKR